MAYTKTNWKDGDVISAEKMNKIEQGIEDAGASGGSDNVFMFDDNTTYTDALHAADSGKAVLASGGLVVMPRMTENSSEEGGAV